MRRRRGGDRHHRRRGGCRSLAPTGSHELCDPPPPGPTAPRAAVGDVGEERTAHRELERGDKVAARVDDAVGGGLGGRAVGRERCRRGAVALVAEEQEPAGDEGRHEGSERDGVRGHRSGGCCRCSRRGPGPRWSRAQDCGALCRGEMEAEPSSAAAAGAPAPLPRIAARLFFSPGRSTKLGRAQCCTGVRLRLLQRAHGNTARDERRIERERGRGCNRD